MNYCAKTVTGLDPETQATTYDEANVSFAESKGEAISAAFSMPGTKDVISDHGAVVARVHVDGGIDYYAEAAKR